MRHWLKSGGGWLLVAIAASIVALVLDWSQIPTPLPEGGGWYGLLASGLVSALWRARYEDARQRARHTETQQQEFRRSLTVSKVAEVFDRVLALLGDQARGAASGPYSQGRPGRLREVNEVVYKGLVYVHDRVLLEDIVQSFEATVRGRRARVLELQDRIAERFRQHLVGLSGLDDSGDVGFESVDFQQFRSQLTRLNKAMIGLRREAGLVPIKIKQQASLVDWCDTRFAKHLTWRQIQEVSTGLTQEFLRQIQPDDLVLFWRDPRYSANDGVLGVAWVTSVDPSKKAIHLGRRITVTRDRLVRFTGLDQQDFERAVRDGRRLDQTALDYDKTASLAEVIEKLDARRERLSPGRHTVASIPGQLSKLKGTAIRLALDFNKFAEDRMAERFLEELVERTSSGAGITLTYEGVEYQVTSVNPRLAHVHHDPFSDLVGQNPDDLINRSFAAINMTPVASDVPAQLDGWQERVSVAMRVDDHHDLEILLSSD